MILSNVAIQTALDEHRLVIEPEPSPRRLTPGEPRCPYQTSAVDLRARCGLLVHFTAPTIHAGFKGTITLEMINPGPYSIVLHQLMPICQLIVEEVRGVPFRNHSQFQNQSRAVGN